jgi:DNA-binding transcriptional ArsR family regulator
MTNADRAALRHALFALAVRLSGDTLDAVDRELVLAALERSAWNMSRAARALRVDRKRITRTMARHRLKKPPRRADRMPPPQAAEGVSRLPEAAHVLGAWSPDFPLTTAQRAILTVLQLHTNASGRSSLMHAAIARATGLSVKSVTRHLRALRELGWLEVSILITKTGRQNVYQLRTPKTKPTKGRLAPRR